MSKCELCGKECEKVSRDGVCFGCMEDLVSNIKAGGKHQKQAVVQIEQIAMRQLMETSLLIDYWTMADLAAEGQKGRYDKASSCKIVSIDLENKKALFEGSGSSVYETTLKSCNCMDCSIRRLPCKHIYRLAKEIERSKKDS